MEFLGFVFYIAAWTLLLGAGVLCGGVGRVVEGSKWRIRRIGEGVNISRLSPARGGAEASERAWGPGTAGAVERSLLLSGVLADAQADKDLLRRKAAMVVFFKKKANCHL